VTALDALRVVNFLSRRQPGSATPGTVSVNDIGTAPPDFLDVNGDGVITAFDALDVLNQLRLINNTEGELVSQSGPMTSPVVAAAFSSAIVSPVTSGMPSRQIEWVADDDDTAPTISADDATDQLLSNGFAVENASAENMSQLLAQPVAASGPASDHDDAIAAMFDEFTDFESSLNG
jgi:hypothetical protein